MKEIQPKLKQVTQCIVCSQENEVGMFIWDQFICRNCEGEMVETEVYDEKYPFFIKQMRKIWFKENA